MWELRTAQGGLEVAWQKSVAGAASTTADAPCPLHPFPTSKWLWETTHQRFFKKILQLGNMMYLVWGSLSPSQCPMDVVDMKMMKPLVQFWLLCCFTLALHFSYYTQLRLESILSDLLDTGGFRRGDSQELTQRRSPTR